MPDIEKNIEDAIRSIKKILVSKGKASGNFYAICNSKNEGGLAVTMSAKDPKGAKALTMGKSMKSEIKNGKFARGLIIFDKEQKKLLFEVSAGNLSSSNLKKALKTGFGSNNLKKLTQKAKVTKPGEVVTPEPNEVLEDTTGEEVTNEEIASLTLSADELSELASEQVALSDLNASLGSFLSIEDDDEAIETIISSSIDEIQRLNNDGATPEQKAEAMTAISSVVEFERSESPDSISTGMLHLLEEATKIDEILPPTISENEDFLEQIEAAKQSFFTQLKQVGQKHLRGEITKYNSFPKPEEDTLELSLADTHDPIYTSIRDALYARHLPTSKSMSDGTWASSFLESVNNPDSIKMIELYHPEVMRAITQKWTDLPINCLRKHIDECASSWEKVKERYIKTPIIMEKFIAYRKKTVDDLLKTLRGKHKSGGQEVLLAKSVGSQNLTSDYDLTLSSADGSGIEIDAIREFNATIKGTYSKQPGTVFDTNLYAKDFLKVKDTILTEGGEEDGALDAIETFSTLETEDQDIAALTKMCQYMGKEAWGSYTESVLSEIADPLKKSSVEKQMREAANLLTIKRLEILKSFTNAVNVEEDDDTAMWEDTVRRLQTKKQGASEEQQEKIDDCLENCGYLLGYLEKMQEIRSEMSLNPAQQRLDAAIASNSSKEDIADAQRAVSADAGLMAKQNELGEFQRYYSNLMEEVLAEVEHFFDDEILEARNDIYMDKMQSIRDIQNKHRALDGLKGEVLDETAIKAVLTEGDKASFEACDTAEKKQEWLALKSDSLKEQAKRMLGEANFFAAEAYLSEGPLQHIVFGNQSGNLAAMEKLKPEHFLESVNEQTGDFMKDIGHHGHNSGEAFIQTAKYLSRMFEGITKLNGKMASISEVNFEDIPKSVGWQDASAMKARIETDLMPIRGAKGQYATMNDDEKYRIGAELGNTIYGSSSVNDLVSKVLAMSAKLNAMVRQEIEMRSDHEGLKYQESTP